MIGFVNPDELAPLYAGAAVFCFPSIREGFGLPVLEAMAQGTPVVTSAGTSTAEVGGDAAMLVEPTDAEAIADALNFLLSDPARAGVSAPRAPCAPRPYSWEQTAGLLADAYREVAA